MRAFGGVIKELPDGLTLTYVLPSHFLSLCAIALDSPVMWPYSVRNEAAPARRLSASHTVDTMPISVADKKRARTGLPPAGRTRPAVGANPHRHTVTGLGAKVRTRREGLGLSLRAVTSEIDISPSFLAQIEREEADPSLETLQGIARVLQVPMLYFFTEEPAPQRIVHPQKRRHLHFLESNVTYELLAPDLSRHSMGLVMRVGPGAHINPIRLAEPTEEWLLVLDGAVEIELNGNVFQLRAGDSIYYEGWEFQGLTATGRREAVLIGSMTPPAF